MIKSTISHMGKLSLASRLLIIAGLFCAVKLGGMQLIDRAAVSSFVRADSVAFR